MKIVGLITEYNPFHNGHLYHLQKAKEMTGADAAVAVMSGNYVQRGLPAVTEKYSRARAAVMAGVDAVIELPLIFALSSAEGFARGAVSTLEKLGCVTDIVYGTEAAEEDIGLIKSTAGLLIDEPESYRELLRAFQKEGMSFPKARAAAAESICHGAGRILSGPNNILAVEYEKAILTLGCGIKTHSIRRSDEGYLESATAIRQLIEKDDNDSLRRLLPECSLKTLRYHISADDFTDLLNYKITMSSEAELTRYLDVNDEIAARIKKACRNGISFSQLASEVSSKNYTESRARRCLLHILLDIKADSPAPSFIRCLAFNSKSGVMKRIKESAKAPLVCNLSECEASGYVLDERAALVYNDVVRSKYGISLPDEYHAGVFHM